MLAWSFEPGVSGGVIVNVYIYTSATVGGYLILSWKILGTIRYERVSIWNFGRRREYVP